MREIKFRGLCVDTSEWLYGCYVFLIGVGSDGIEVAYNIPPSYNDPGGSHDYKRFEVKNGTIGQLTGLKDKNGKDIYEGDLFKGKGCLLYEVVFENAAFYLNHVQKFMSKRWGLLNILFDSDMVDIYENIEVVGNIHQNPELLKQNQ